ncbi:MAG: DUF5672 family protein [Patescibacteria group bacterium]
MKTSLPNVTLIGVDCIDIERLRIAADICEKDFSFGAVKLLSSIPSDDPRVIKIPAIRSTKEYSEFCIKDMARYVDTEFALIFQHDGFILNPAAWTGDFLNYDYIGAPWYHLGGLRVGNGGFSLRSKRLLEHIAAQYKTIGGALDPEDMWICQTARASIEKAGMSFAPEKLAKQFSKEGDHHSVMWNGEFGFHGIKYTDISLWLEQHPEYKEKLVNPLDDYARLMKKYPVWDGTVHTLRYRTIHMPAFKALAAGQRGYDARADDDLDEESMTPGQTVVFKRSGVPFAKVPIAAFERKIKTIEHFATKSSLLAKYPGVQITYPVKVQLPKWKSFLARTLGNAFCPRSKPYTLLRFEP